MKFTVLLVSAMLQAAPAQDFAYPHLKKEDSARLSKIAADVCANASRVAAETKNTRLSEAHKRHCVETKPPSVTGLIVAFHHLNLETKRSQKTEKAFFKSTIPVLAISLKQYPDFPEPPAVWSMTGAIQELSGLAHDKKRNVLWSHGDSGTGEFIGRTDLKTFKTEKVRVENAKNHDWEAIVVDSKARVWILDVGDNLGARKKTRLYRVDPEKIKDGSVAAEREIGVRFESGAHDIEAGVVEGDTLYLIGKDYYKRSRVHSVDLRDEAEDSQIAKALGETPVVPPISDATLTSDGRLILLTYFGLYELLNWKDPKARALKQLNSDVLGQIEAITSVSPDSVYIGREDGKVFSSKIR